MATDDSLLYSPLLSPTPLLSSALLDSPLLSSTLLDSVHKTVSIVPKIALENLERENICFRNLVPNGHDLSQNEEYRLTWENGTGHAGNHVTTIRPFSPLLLLLLHLVDHLSISIIPHPDFQYIWILLWDSIRIYLAHEFIAVAKPSMLKWSQLQPGTRL